MRALCAAYRLFKCAMQDGGGWNYCDVPMATTDTPLPFDIDEAFKL